MVCSSVLRSGVIISIGGEGVAVNNAATSTLVDMCAGTERLASAERDRSLGRDAASRGNCIGRPGGVRSTSEMGGPSAVFGAFAVEEALPPNFLAECRRWSTVKPAPTLSVDPVCAPSAAGPDTGASADA